MIVRDVNFDKYCQQQYITLNFDFMEIYKLVFHIDSLVLQNKFLILTVRVKPYSIVYMF